ncbi:GNAT family N-acetyltransferase [Kitasatospora sp. NBC_01300]|uniref:GNAT family N-acetyltransferase n=1 Tax=Kitasatospora sp. NBC_01300 TaxID=2903574 RepID=UPI002F909F72|nr:GNAT family N-acetyltransferase [Kitasatospora sp. NBC_01300]
MNTPTELTLRTHGPQATTAMLDTLTDIWTAAHTGHDDVADAGFTPDALRRQITGHTRHDHFTLVTAHPAGEGAPIGFGYGFRCSPAYWLGPTLLSTISSPVTTVDTLAGLCELAVLPAWQGRGVGSTIHHALVDALATDWASLLAMPGEDRPEQRLYRRLGYHYAGPYQPAPDAPVLDLLLLYQGC